MDWAKQWFKTEKPIIAMCHVRALPGDYYYDEAAGMEWVVKKAREDLLALQKGGVDAIMFSNEFSLPYLKKVRPETTAALSRVIGELKSDIKDLRSEMRSDFRIVWAGMFAIALGLAGMMAKGFGWL